MTGEQKSRPRAYSAPQSAPQDRARQVPPGPPVRSPADGKYGDNLGPLEFLLNLTRQYGDLVRYEQVYGATYLVNHPDFIGHVLQHPNYPRGSLLKMVLGEGLLASEGDHWRRQRRLTQPHFQPQRIAGFGSMITDTTREMLQRWQAFADRGQPVDVAEEMLSLTVAVIIKAMFSGDISREAGKVTEALKTLIADVGGFVQMEFGTPRSISPSRNNQFQATLRTVNDVVYTLIHERRQRNESSGDLLSLLLAARDQTGEGLSDLQVRDEVVTLLFAGSETTSLAIGWTWYLLGLHPPVERRVHAELDELLARRTPTVQDLANLKYTRMVFQESMRMYPPVWSIFRKAAADDQIGGYHIPAKATVVVSPYAMHRHPGFWQNPDQFDPERFAPELTEQRPRYAYIPFGGGPHACMGNHFAMMEGLLILATVAQQYRLRLVPGHVVEPMPLITLRQRQGILATLDPRPFEN